MNKSKRHKTRRMTGEIPGSVIFTGRKKVDEVKIHYLHYGSDFAKEIDYHPSDNQDGHQVWMDVRGLHDVELIKELGSQFKLHPLVLEDMADVAQRPKSEEYADAIFINIKHLALANQGEITQEHISIVIQDHLVISLQEDTTDIFTKVRSRILAGAGRVRGKSPFYLGYVLLDTIVDEYYHILDYLSDELERLENEIHQDSTENTKKSLYVHRQKIVNFRRQVSPLREATGRLLRSEHYLIDDGSKIYIQDLYDHVMHITETLDMKREMINSLQDLYLSEISFKMNNIMQVLTIISTIFIPLSFIVGLYGMNFEYIPELEVKYGYFYTWGVMLLLSILLLLYFRKKKWL